MQFQHTKPRFGDQVPPAIFTPILGLMGLGLAWRRGGDVLGLPNALPDMILGAVTLLLLFCALAYGVKFLRRPATLGEDIRTVPGRAGLAAMTMGFFCLAAALVPFSAALASLVLFTALGIHTILAVLKARLLLSQPVGQRQITPVWHLSFVGYIVAPLAAIPLGYDLLSKFLFVGTLVFACAIWLLNLREVFSKGCTPPLRPTLAIHLAPASFFCIIAVDLGSTALGLAFGALAVVMLAVLLSRVFYLTAAGFSPFWGAFTFPLAAFASAMLSLADQGQVFGVVGVLSLAAASAIIPVIAVRILKLWPGGQLTLKTNAARV